MPGPTPTIDELCASLGIPASYDRRGLARHAEAPREALIEAGPDPDGGSVFLLRPAAAAWFSMRDAAARDAIVLLPISGFRSIARQTELIREKLATGRALDDILRFVAAPGYSEHHTGRALDIGSPEHVELEEDFAGTAAFAWLERHAGRFGFRLSYPRGNHTGIGYEPWHWCWHPPG